eukprot:TRINITY_DN5236_c2_g1_i1.p1 TRINITY_DN5236_c2_g1~~TRINITY_DN5236_c2_g1_i1.p1  ORF type:complete len:112 (-),score=7.21 TRINITY_DN5236_c2_g1_i1:400-735(-)
MKQCLSVAPIIKEKEVLNKKKVHQNDDFAGHGKKKTSNYSIKRRRKGKADPRKVVVSDVGKTKAHFSAPLCAIQIKAQEAHVSAPGTRFHFRRTSVPLGTSSQQVTNPRAQ